MTRARDGAVDKLSYRNHSPKPSLTTDKFSIPARLRRIVAELGLLRARHPEDDVLAALYHDVLDRLREAEIEQEVQP